jgi:hypothetical protein
MTGSEASPAKGLVVTTVRGDKRRCLGQRPKKRRFSRHLAKGLRSDEERRDVEGSDEERSYASSFRLFFPSLLSTRKEETVARRFALRVSGRNDCCGGAGGTVSSFLKKAKRHVPSLCLNSNGFAVMERSTTLGSLLPSCSPLPPPPCLVLDRIPFIVIDREPNPRSTSSERKSENSDIFTFRRGGCSAPLPTSSEACFPRAKERAAAACYP